MLSIWILYQPVIANIQPINRNVYIHVPIYHYQVIDGGYLLAGIKMREDKYFKPTKYIDLTNNTCISVNYNGNRRSPAYREKLFQDNKLASHVLDTIYLRSMERCPDPTDEIFKDRLDLIRSKLELILLQLNQRTAINRKILYQIDRDSCKVRTLNL